MSTANSGEDWQEALSHGGVCACPVCRGMAFGNTVASTATATAGTALAPLTSIPVLNSLPGARATLFLDFDGNTEAQWGGYRNVVTPVFDRDGDRTSFNDAELTTIREIWARTAEDYAPFQINVSTVDPGNATDRVTARIAIGDNWSDLF